MNAILSLFQYGFIVRGFEAGIIVAVIAPLIGIFLVLRRYSMIADVFSHVSLAGLAIGFLLGVNPIFTALAVTVAASLGIERLRTTKKVYGESALSIFLSGGLAIAVILLSIGRGLNANLFNYLFGSIVTVTDADVYIIGALGLVVITLLALFYKELFYIAFDEEAARVSGIPIELINTVLIVLTAITISLSIPIVGVLLISALMVLPVLGAMQLKKSFAKTIAYAELISIFSVISGIISSFYLNISTGGTIVLIMILIFSALSLVRDF